MASMMNGEHQIIGVLIGDVSFEFTSELMSGISDAAIDADARVLFFLGMQKHSAQMENIESTEIAVSHNSVYDYASLSGADSFIIACGSLTGFAGNARYQKFLDRFEMLPYVVLQERAEIDSPKHTYIVIDNYNSYMRCMEHLITVHGYRKIAFLSGPEGHADARERMRAYRDSMQQHHLPIEPSLIETGDFYEYVDSQVAKLLDNNPGLEAIAFANDEMAKAGYRECRRRGLVVGRDIAITGFDNFRFCHTMEPPLTTVSQDAYKMGRLAVEKAIKLSKGKTMEPYEMQTEFIIRQSCGCLMDNSCFIPATDQTNAEAYLDYAISGMLDSYGTQFAHDERERYMKALRDCLEQVRALALNGNDQSLDFDALYTVASDFVEHSPQPIQPIVKLLEDFLLRILCTSNVSAEVHKFITAIVYMQQFIHNHEVHALQRKFDSFQAQSWIAPELTRGLYDQDADEDVYRCIVERLKTVGLRNIYICLLEEPQRYGSGGLAVIPQKVLLAAYSNADEIKVFARDGMPAVDMARPFCNLPGFLDARSMMAFSFFSGENQYGILFCETDESRSALLHVIGLQLGMLIDFLELRRKENAIAEELESIREKNEILNFLSEYDLMCGLLNRRGFIERAIRSNRENIGKTAYCAFLDLDYLKQINDTFGHPEGDIALQAVGSILQKSIGEYDLIGRIGGDEFVGLFITEEPNFDEVIRKRIRKECDRYNAKACRAYILDISIGIARFVCQQGLEISGIIAEADKYLYEAKRSRLTTSLRLRGKHTKIAREPKPSEP